MKYLTAYQLLDNISDVFPSCVVFAFAFLCAILRLATLCLASLQDPSRKVKEEEPDGEKAAEVAQTDKVHTDFPISVIISAAGVEVLMISLRNGCSSSLLSVFSLLRPSVCGSLVEASRSLYFSKYKAAPVSVVQHRI